MRALLATCAASIAPLVLLSASCTAPIVPQFEELDFPIPGAIGRLYTHTTEPLDVNFMATRAATSSSRGDLKRITYSNLSLEWGVNGIGELGKRGGFDEVFYADLEVRSILGIWTQTWVHVYGR